MKSRMAGDSCTVLGEGGGEIPLVYSTIYSTIVGVRGYGHSAESSNML